MAKRTRIMYIEYKGDGLVRSARIGRVTYSKTGNTLHYSATNVPTEIDEDVREEYWSVIRKKPSLQTRKHT
jgi:hypothetical protein